METVHIGRLTCGRDVVVDDQELFDELSVRLRAGHRRVASLDLPDDEKARVAKRLLAISDSAKHDLRRASTRLDHFFQDLDEGWRPGPKT